MGPFVLTNFEIVPIEAARGQVKGGYEQGSGDGALFFGWGEFGLSRLTSLQFIPCHGAGFYKPAIPQSPPPPPFAFAGLQHMQ
jgi:hypothetical protein